ncbi:hypothetical protein AMELA_G00232760 [Ameiurus melas]|uniref:Uncharacterized protein n=1 Tax=Ameiurus melas TaxID=219545 RepID=A0A7J5ZXC5_AMEME|nr:hypothetical protein AMELA_G00232760 [Ameiurus melas]
MERTSFPPEDTTGFVYLRPGAGPLSQQMSDAMSLKDFQAYLEMIQPSSSRTSLVTGNLEPISGSIGHKAGAASGQSEAGKISGERVPAMGDVNT